MSTSSTTHRGTASVIAIATLLGSQEGWALSTTIAEKVGLNRTTTQRVLAEMQRSGWAVAREVDGAQWWQLGPELPRIGIHYQTRLIRESERIRAQYEAASRPLDVPQ